MFIWEVKVQIVLQHVCWTPVCDKHRNRILLYKLFPLCGCSSKNGPHRLIYLNVYLPGVPQFERIRIIRKFVPVGNVTRDGLEVSKAHMEPRVLLCAYRSGCSSQILPQCLPTCCHVLYCHKCNRLNLWNYKERPK